MNRCLDLAALAEGETSPNPMVGAVVVHQDRIIGEGYHHRCGEAHAEVNAIASVQNRELLKDATLYVSLEPCNHVGKTPACTDLILKVGIPRVVVAVQDPFPKVNGSGIERLRKEGVEVITGVLESEAALQNRRFFTFHRAKRPYIILKWAESADGFLDGLRPASGMGISNKSEGAFRISNEWTRILLHRWRSQEDAIMVGTQTALMDNPALTARVWEGKNPVRIVPDRTLRLPEDLTLFSDASAQTWLITDARLLAKAQERFEHRSHIQVFGIDVNSPADPRTGILAQMLHLLYEQNRQSLLVEGGRELLLSFLELGLWDEIRIFRAPAVFLNKGVSAPPVPKGFTRNTRWVSDNEWITIYNTLFSSSR